MDIRRTTGLQNICTKMHVFYLHNFFFPWSFSRQQCHVMEYFYCNFYKTFLAYGGYQLNMEMEIGDVDDKLIYCQ